ncbi:MAG: hypothetical protein ACRELY_10540 [Polyangiaceae bacterium]
MNARGAVGICAIAFSPAIVVLLSFDARARRRTHAEETPVRLAVVHRLPSSDLALSGGARWLRTPSLEEPGAAFSDGPALQDPDPAGGAISPPREVWTEEAKIRSAR